jgi:D-glycero-alpha-D-manno-heptose-7-phosphate kinase
MKQVLKKIYSSAPVRICDVGGWTDTWFSGHGSVFNIGVSPNVEVQITCSLKEAEERITLNLRNYQDTYSLNPDKIIYNKHPLIEAAIDSYKIPADISLDIDVFSQIPSGASVGTSAAVCVALIGALDALSDGQLTPHEIAVQAHKVETDKLGLQSGIQDQLCCAYGGINYIHMHCYPRAVVHPLKVEKDFIQELENRLVLVYIGTPHNSSDIHQMVIADLGEEAERDPRIERLRVLAADAKHAVIHRNFARLGEVMNQNTEVQRKLHPGLVGKKYEEIIEIANFYEVSGCKVNGAGGDGGSITILANGDSEQKRALIGTLEEKGYLSIPISVSHQGVQVKVN